MDVSFESVDGAPVEMECVSGDEVEERDLSFDTAITTGHIEITENYSDQEDGEELASSTSADLAESESYDINQYGLGMLDTQDPTETLQKVLQDSQSSGLPLRQIKEEPNEDKNEYNIMEPGHSQSKDSTSDDSHPVKPVKSLKRPAKSVPTPVQPGPASSKEKHVTRSGRKTTFTGMEKKKTSQKTKESPPAKKKPPTKKKTAEEEPVAEESKCLVCSRPWTYTVEKNDINYPFCFPCKKTYFSQHKTAANRGRRVNQKCSKGARCKINYRGLNQWCITCHFNKFENTLKDLNVEFDLNTKKLIKRRGNRQRAKYESAEPVNTENAVLKNDALGNSSSVLLQRMSTRELADYGIEMENSVKDEPINYDASLSKSSNVSPASKRSFEEKDANPKAKKFPKRLEPEPYVLSVTRIENTVQNPNVPEISHQSGKKEPTEKKKPQRNKKILMEYSSSDDDADPVYSLPAVNSGQDAVASAQISKSVSEVMASTPDARKQQEEPSQMENENNYVEVLESIKVYVFTCGHACGSCNSGTSKEWLKESGFYTAKPMLSGKSSKPSTSKRPAPQKSNPSSSNAKRKPDNVAAEVKNYTSISAIPPNVLQNILDSTKAKVQVKIMKKKPSEASNVSNKDDGPFALAATVSNDAEKSQNSDSRTVTDAQIQQSSSMSNSSLVQSLQNVTGPLVFQIPSVQKDTSSVTVASQKTSTGNITAAAENVSNEVIHANTSVPVIQNVSNTITPKVVPIVTKLAAPVVQDVTKTVKLQARIENTAATISKSTTNPIISRILHTENTSAPKIQTVSQLGNAQNAVVIDSSSIGKLLELQKQGYVLTPVNTPTQVAPVKPSTTSVPVSQNTTNSHI